MTVLSQGQSKFLEGNLREEGKLNSSLKIVPMPMLNGHAGAVGIQQYAAGGTYSSRAACSDSSQAAHQAAGSQRRQWCSTGADVTPGSSTSETAPQVGLHRDTREPAAFMTFTPGGAVKVLQPLGPATRPAPKPATLPPGAKTPPELAGHLFQDWHASRAIWLGGSAEPFSHCSNCTGGTEGGASDGHSPTLAVSSQCQASCSGKLVGMVSNGSLSKAIYEQWQRLLYRSGGTHAFASQCGARAM